MSYRRRNRRQSKRSNVPESVMLQNHMDTKNPCSESLRFPARINFFTIFLNFLQFHFKNASISALAAISENDSAAHPLQITFSPWHSCICRAPTCRRYPLINVTPTSAAFFTVAKDDSLYHSSPICQHIAQSIASCQNVSRETFYTHFHDA